MKNKNDSIIEVLMAAGIIGSGTVIVLFIAFLISCILNLIPTTIVWGLLYYALPAFGVSYYVTFLQCYLGVFILRILGGLLNGGSSNSSN